MKVLWAPWRMAYVGGPRPAGCIFCEAWGAGDDTAALVLARTHGALVMMNRYPYANGHLMVAPRRHCACPTELQIEEHRRLADALRATVEVLREVLRPEGFNIGMNLGAAAGAGVPDHLHWHIVPRWVGDTNFVPLLADVRVMPEHLQALHTRLKPAFDRLEGGAVSEERSD